MSKKVRANKALDRDLKSRTYFEGAATEQKRFTFFNNNCGLGYYSTSRSNSLRCPICIAEFIVFIRVKFFLYNLIISDAVSEL